MGTGDSEASNDSQSDIFSLIMSDGDMNLGGTSSIKESATPTYTNPTPTNTTLAPSNTTQTPTNATHTLSNFGFKIENNWTPLNASSNDSSKKRKSRQVDDLCPPCKKQPLECPICLDVKSGKQVVKPSGCDHEFCPPCLKMWAKRNSVCPIDRKRFDSMRIVDHDTGRLIKEIDLNGKQIFRGKIPIEDQYCSICKHVIAGKLMARPGTCQHNFCVDCLKKYGRINGRCPVDGSHFMLIRIVDIISGNVDRVIDRINGMTI